MGSCLPHWLQVLEFPMVARPRAGMKLLEASRQVSMWRLVWWCLMRAPCTSGSSLWTTHWCRGLPLTCEDVRGCPRKIKFSHHHFPCFTARHARRRDLCRYPGRILREIWDWNFWALGIWDGIVQLPAAQELLRHPGKQPRNVVYPSILMFSIYVHRIFRGSQPIAWIASFIRIF